MNDIFFISKEKYKDCVINIENENLISKNGLSKEIEADKKSGPVNEKLIKKKNKNKKKLKKAINAGGEIISHTPPARIISFGYYVFKLACNCFTCFNIIMFIIILMQHFSFSIHLALNFLILFLMFFLSTCHSKLRKKYKKRKFLKVIEVVYRLIIFYLNVLFFVNYFNYVINIIGLKIDEKFYEFLKPINEAIDEYFNYAQKQFKTLITYFKNKSERIRDIKKMF